MGKVTFPSILKRIIIAVLFAGVCLGMMIRIYEAFAPDPLYKEVALDKGWTASLNGKVYENVNLSEYLFPMTNKGDILELDTYIPKNLDIKNPVLECYSVHSVVDVYVDDALVYSYGHDLYQAKELLGYGYNFIELPQNYEGKKLKVVFTVSENNAFEGIPAMYIVNGSQMLRHWLSEWRFSLLITMFLMGFGILGMVVSIYTFLRSGKSFVKVFCVSMLSFLTGCWTLCNGDLIFLFVNDLHTKVYLEYISFFMIPIPFIGYFSDLVINKECPKLIKFFYRILLGASILLFAVIMFTQVLNIVHFPIFVTAAHALLALSILFLIVYALVQIHANKKMDIILAIGFTITIIVIANELIRFNLSKYFIGFSANKYNSTVSVAALIMIVTLFMDFYIKITDNMKEEAQQKLLEKMVYIDELTGLVNRRKCDEVRADLDVKKQEYSIISLDMNRLKAMNDTYGHEVGDRALQLFAKQLKKVFPENATIGRIGGDEFLIIMLHMSKNKTEEYMHKLLSQLEAYNRTDDVITLSTAWGIADSKEAKNAHLVYCLADERMYENKRMSKMSRDAINYEKR